MTAIITGISDVVSVVGEVFTVMVGNPLLVFFIGVGVLGSGIGLFSRLRGATKR